MATTQRFGFEYFGGDTEGALSDKGSKFTNRDRRTLDRLLAAFEMHDHSGGDRLEDPSEAPALTLLPTGGGLAAGTTFYYRIAYVDAYGLETAASAEVSVTTPAPTLPPQAPRVEAVEGGTLDPGLYWIAASVIVDGKETQLSAPSLITISDWNTIRVSFPDGLPAGADQVSIWRQGPLDGGFTRLVTLDAATFVSWDDDGTIPPDDCACDPSHLPPAINQTGATARVQVDVPAADIALPTDVERWRVYRTTTSGVYGAASLVAEVSDTDEEAGGLLVGTFIDDGLTGLLLGAPLEQSQTITPSTDIGGGGAGGQLFIADASGTTWRIWSDLDGVITTSPLSTPVEGVDTGFGLQASDGTMYRVTISTDGALETIEGWVAGERSHELGDGPHLPTTDGASTFQLAVDPDGVLETLGDAELRGEVHLPERDEPPTPLAGGVMWVGTDGGLRFKGKAGTVTLIASA